VEFTLLGAVFIAVVPLYLVLRWEAARSNAATCTRNLWDIALGAVVTGVFIGRLAAMIGDGVNPITHPGDILIFRGGVATGPAAVAAIATAAWFGRGVLWPVLDGLSAAALAGLAGWHSGCIVRDSCLGTPSDLPWAFAQEGSTVARHPVEIYAAVLLLAAALLLVWWRTERILAPGIPMGIALAVASGTRLFSEPMRPSLGSGPVWWYVAGIAVGLAAIAWSQRRSKAQPASETK